MTFEGVGRSEAASTHQKFSLSFHPASPVAQPRKSTTKSTFGAARGWAGAGSVRLNASACPSP